MPVNRQNKISSEEDFLSLRMCSCPSGSRKYLCKHSVGLATKFKHREIPDSAKSVPLNEKRSRGKPAKKKGWWSHGSELKINLCSQLVSVYSLLQKFRKSCCTW